MFKLLGSLARKWFDVEIRYRGNWKRDNKWLLDRKFKTIIDVGANEGQFAMKMRKFFPDAQIISFEPIPHIFDQLNSHFSGDAKFTSYQYGLGEAEGEHTFFLNQNSASSSLLKLKDHAVHFSKAVEEKPITIHIKKLDDILQQSNLQQPILVKLDVQGYEDKVIAGGLNTLKAADMVLTEVSFANLYEGQKLFHDIYTTLLGLGFNYKGNYEQLYSPVNNAILQADAIFIKE